MLKKLNSWARRRVRKWLGVDRDHSASINYIQTVERRLADASEGAVDVGFKGNTQIIVVSRLRGGRISIFDIEAKDIRELHERAAHVLGPAWPDAVIDAPADFKRIMNRETRAIY